MIVKKIFEKIIPKPVFLIYHWFLAYLAGFIYGWPSKKMIVIGVTGTSGKSTVVNLIGKVLEQAGFKVGIATTFNFRIAGQETVNKTRMTMLGRFALQKLLKKMFLSGCRYAVIETSSQGIVQSRHLGINYDVGVFTGLSFEHLEAHGGFEKYREAKQKLFQHLSGSGRKKIEGRIIDKVIIVNADDENSSYFLDFRVDKKYGYTIKNLESEFSVCRQAKGELKQDKDFKIKFVKADNIQLGPNGSDFTVKGIKFKINLLGEFNVANALAAIGVASSQGVDLNVCRDALSRVGEMPGRMEIVVKNPFMVIVDYAHTPDHLEKVYQTLKKFSESKLICVLGATGGGRDKWKRPVLGKIAMKYGDYVIITNEDPYDENPEEIIDQVITGIEDNSEMIFQKRLFKIVDRGQAIKKALSLAKAGDAVIITGKGAEQCIMIAGGKRVFWDDREAARKELKNFV